MRIIVCIKQVFDPLTPVNALTIDSDRKKILGSAYTPPVINGYDEQALEAALRIKENWPGGECEIVALSLGERFKLDVMKKALAVGADELVLVDDAAFDTADSVFIARALAAAIHRLGGADLVLCGRQASDWDNAQAPLLLGEMLGWPCLTLARRVEVRNGRVEVERVLSDGSQVMESNLPAVVTVTSELGELRFPPARARLQVARRRPKEMTLKELNVEIGSPAAEVIDVSLLKVERECQYIGGANGAEAGRRLAETLIDAGLISPNGG
ncbi:MAG: electron transfer flavoprotein subunit beta/FixA family protein [Chloroflexi bacterium]|nr:electron transfer flavoprotein subunit beta/FixA family protein [Chloroflexota bacterium]